MSEIIPETPRLCPKQLPAICHMTGLGRDALRVVDNFVTSVQWSRRFIGLKLFLALASRGERRYAEMIEDQAEVGDYMNQRLEEAGWVHVSSSPLPICCVTHPRGHRRARCRDERRRRSVTARDIPPSARPPARFGCRTRGGSELCAHCPECSNCSIALLPGDE